MGVPIAAGVAILLFGRCADGGCGNIGPPGIVLCDDLFQHFRPKALSMEPARIPLRATPFAFPHSEVLIVATPERQTRVMSKALDMVSGFFPDHLRELVVVGIVAAGEREVLPDEDS